MEATSEVKRLDSWKAIARYLGRSCRTVQRWQEEHRLPVRRVGVTGSVFAYANELDEWLQKMPSVTEEPGAESGPQLVRYDPADGKPHLGDGYRLPGVPAEAREHSDALVALAARMWRVLSHGNLGSVTQTFRQAIDLDCTNPAPFSGLASAFVVKSILEGIELHDAYISARAALRRATDLDPELPEAACMHGWIKILEDRDWKGAHAALEAAAPDRALTSTIQIGMGLLHVAHGRTDEASELFHTASMQSALNSVWAEIDCWGMYLTGDISGALKRIARSRSSGHSGPVLDSVEALLVLQAGQPISRLESLWGSRAVDHHGLAVLGALGYAYSVTNQGNKANDLLRILTSPSFAQQDHYAIALVLLGLKRNHEAVERLKMSFSAGSLWSLSFRSDPMLRSLRGCATFQEFVRHANYPGKTLDMAASDVTCEACSAVRKRARQ